MPNMPGTYLEEYRNLTSTYRPKDKYVSIDLIDNNSLDFTDIMLVLDKHKRCKVTIHNIYSRDVLNFLCNMLSNIKYDGNIILKISKEGKEYSIDDFTNGNFVNIESLPNKVKLDAFPNLNEQNEFTTWAHNLSFNDKEKLKKCLIDDNRKSFEDQELIMHYLSRDIIRHYPSIRTFDERARFNIIFDYVCRSFYYNPCCLKQNGHIKENCTWATDPVETYKRGCGVCSGRSNLITLVSNSPIFNINCITVSGETEGGLPHIWNAIIDNGRVYHYDSTFPRLLNATPTSKVCHKIEGYYPCIKEDIKISREISTNTPELPPRRKKLNPPKLPPRREE